MRNHGTAEVDFFERRVRSHSLFLRCPVLLGPA
jgi:hypothetical protein